MTATTSTKDSAGARPGPKKQDQPLLSGEFNLREFSNVKAGGHVAQLRVIPCKVNGLRMDVEFRLVRRASRRAGGQKEAVKLFSGLQATMLEPIRMPDAMHTIQSDRALVLMRRKTLSQPSVFLTHYSESASAFARA